MLELKYLKNRIAGAAGFIKSPVNRVMMLFTAEAALFSVVNSAVGGNNYWFARRLGASDFQLSLVGSLPQLLGLAALLPCGIFAGKLTDKRNFVVGALIAVAAIYCCVLFVPLFNTPFWAFLAIISLAAAPAAAYTSMVTAFFAETVSVEKRNGIISFRSYFTFLIGMILPLITGLLLANAKTVSGKIMLHQSFFILSAVFITAQTFVLKRIPVSTTNVVKRETRVLKDLGAIFKNRKFLGFMACVSFFYVVWHADWTLWYIGQTQYVGLNEAWVGYATIVNVLAQFITIPFWTKMNARKGFNFSLTFGALGLACMPAVMIISTLVPPPFAPLAFLIMYAPASLAQVSITVSLVQELYKCAPKEHLGLAIAVYQAVVALSNVAMPIVGVRIYTTLGSTVTAFRIIGTTLGRIFITIPKNK